VSNAELARAAQWSPLTSVEACEGLIAISDIAICRWPRCLGRLRVGSMPNHSGQWTSLSANDKSIFQGLVFDYLPNLVYLTKELVKEEIATDIKQALASLHGHHILHGDLEEFNAYPDVGFRNIFLREDTTTGKRRNYFQFPPIMPLLMSPVTSDHRRCSAGFRSRNDYVRQSDIGT
jgi:hypothetical protein